MRKVCTKMVPKKSQDGTEQKANWTDVCLDPLYLFEREPEFFSLNITDDDSQIFKYDPNTAIYSGNSI